MTDVVVIVALLTGAMLSLVGAVGLNRFPDVFARMHAATKPATLGLVLVVQGAAVALGGSHATKLMLVVALQLITAPVGAHMVGRAAHGAGGEMSEETALDELTEAERGRTEGG